MPEPPRLRNSYQPVQVLAWSALLALALVPAWWLQVVVSSVLVEPAQAAPQIARLSAASAALSDGDDIRARFLASFKDDSAP
jgi:hypothetical protein